MVPRKAKLKRTWNFMMVVVIAVDLVGQAEKL
jgi:hypothetical protein